MVTGAPAQVAGAKIGYQHWWMPTLRSTIDFSMERVFPESESPEQFERCEQPAVLPHLRILGRPQLRGRYGRCAWK